MYYKTNNILSLSLLVLATVLFSGCATRVNTLPQNIKLRNAGQQDKILAVMAYGEDNSSYAQRMRDCDTSWFLNRWFCGQGELSALGEPYTYEDRVIQGDSPYTEMAGAIYNRLRGHNAFKHVVLVNDRDEAAAINADYLLVFHINKCYAEGLGANINIFQWITYQGNIDMDVLVYDLDTNACISEQNIVSKATKTAVWQDKKMRNYQRLKLLKGVTANNAVSEIIFNAQ